MKKGLLILFFAVLICGCSPSKQYRTIDGYAQGGTFHISYSPIGDSGKVITTPEEEIKACVEKRLVDIDNSLSGYNKVSLLSKVNNNEEYSLDSLFTELFAVSKKIYLESDGLFDITGAPLFDIWGFGFSNKETISQHKIDSILSFVGMDKVEIKEGRVVKKDPRMKLNFNAIAQGYSCDVVARELEKFGITDYLVEVGMEILCKGLNPKGRLWNIGIDAPKDGNMEAGKSIQDVLMITDVGIVTSGNYRKFYVENGKKYSHTINPKTGYPVEHNLLSATIIATNATIADGYATYCMVLGVEASIEFLESRPDLEGYLVYGDQSDMKVYFTKGLQDKIRKK